MALSDILQKVGNNEILTDEERQELRDETRALDEVISVVKRIIQPGSSAILLSGVRITNGKITASDFIALAPSVVTENPTDAGFTGTFMSGSGETFNGSVYNIGGVKLGVLQWGANQSTGELVAGGGDVFMNQYGFFIKNQEGLIGFQDLTTGTYDKVTIYIDGTDELVLDNAVGLAGSGIRFDVDSPAHVQTQVQILYDAIYFNGVAVISGTITGVTNGDSHDHVGGDGAAITDAALSTTDVTTNNATTSKHGFVVKATAPAANILNVVGIANGETAYTNKSIFDATNPAALGTAAPGTSLIASHRDHVHTLPTPATLGATPNNGWVEVTDSWTYASASTITIPSDGTATYSRWMKIRFKQGGNYKFYICTALTATLITVLVNDDYVVANSAITDVAYSFAENPYQFPRHFKYSPVWTNLTLGNGTDESTVTIHNGQVFFQVNILWGTTTSIGGSVTVTLPVTAAANYAQITPIGIARYKDATGGNAASGIVFSTGVLAVLNSSGTYALGDPLSSTVPFTWTTSDILAFQCNYFAD